METANGFESEGKLEWELEFEDERLEGSGFEGGRFEDDKGLVILVRLFEEVRDRENQTQEKSRAGRISDRESVTLVIDLWI